jgi:hypothetical protein
MDDIRGLLGRQPFIRNEQEAAVLGRIETRQEVVVAGEY